MRITDFLRKENCLASFVSTDKEGVLREMCALLKMNGDIDHEEPLYDALLNREKLGSTGIGDMVAIPHAKTAAVPHLVGAFGLAPEGIDFHSVDDKPVRLIFLLAGAEAATGHHLKALARISRLLKKEEFRSDLHKASSPSEVYSIIATEDDHLG